MAIFIVLFILLSAVPQIRRVSFAGLVSPRYPSGGSSSFITESNAHTSLGWFSEMRALYDKFICAGTIVLFITEKCLAAAAAAARCAFVRLVLI